MQTWRLIVDPPGSGFWNMAVDDALLEAAADGKLDQPILRFYRWDRPTASLGRSQDANEIDAAYVDANGMRRVRRSTGGSTVLHHQEWTYAVVGELGAGLPSGVVDVYQFISQALLESVQTLGIDASGTPKSPSGASRQADQVAVRPTKKAPASCFDVRSIHEIAVDGRKLIGSAQRRKRGAVLQHGSVPLTWDRSALGKVMRGQSDDALFTSLNESSTQPLGFEEVLTALQVGFQRMLGIQLAPGGLSQDERQRAVELYSWKHVSLEWVEHGLRGAREAHWGPHWNP